VPGRPRQSLAAPDPDGVVSRRDEHHDGACHQLGDEEILGRFADAWRVAPGASLLDDTSVPAAPVTAPTTAAAQFSSAAAFGQAIAGELVPTNAAAYDPGVPLQVAHAPPAGDFLAAATLHPS
jgi:hypothetical protein